MNEIFVIDGTNVCCWINQSSSEKMSLKPLLTILIAILDNKNDFYCVFDAATTYKLKEIGKSDEAEILKN